MRAPLVGLVLALALGIALENATRLAPAPSAALVCVALALRVFGPRRVRRAAEALALVALGALALALRLHAPAPVTGARAVALTVESAPEALGAGCRLRAFIHGSPPGRALVHAPAKSCDALPGELLYGRVAVEPHRPRTNPGGGDSLLLWSRRGIPARASVRGEAVARVEPPPRGPASMVERARRAVGDALDPRSVPRARAGPLLRALVTGDRTRLDADTLSAFRRSGTAHLLAVSGLNIAWVFLLSARALALVLGRTGSTAILRRAGPLSRAGGLAAAAAYAALAGLDAPVLRAALMAFAGTVAWLGGRPAASWNALAFAALASLAADPAALFDAGFALSFAAVAGLLAWRPAGGRLAGLVGCTLAASAGTAPLLALFGIPIPASSVVANLVAVPWFELVLALALLVGFVGALVPDAVPLLRLPALAAAELGVRGLALLGSEDVLAGAAAPQAVALASAVAAAVLALRLVWLRRRRAASAIALAGAAIAAGAALLPGADPVREPELLFLDVGHGDAALLRAPDGAWLVDAGPQQGGYDAGARIVVPALRASGVRALDVLVVTHADRDHAGGAASVIEAVPTGEVWITAAALGSRGVADLRRAAIRRSVAFRVVGAGDSARLGSLALDVLWPPPGAAVGPSNEGSIVLRVEGPGACALLAADATAAVERRLAEAARPCDVLKLAHHGSASSSDAAFLARLDPGTAIASAGRRARPLPHPSVRARLAARRTTLWETRRFGAIRVLLGARGPMVAPFLAEPLED